MESLESEEGRKKQLPAKKLSTSRKLMLRIFLKSDIKNPSIRKSLGETKKNLIRNMDGKNIRQEDLHDLFRLYAGRDKDIYIPFHLRTYTSKFFVPASDMQFPIDEYLQLLKVIRHAFVPIKLKFDRRKYHALKAAQKKTKNDLADGTEFGYENYRKELNISLDTLYVRDVTPDLLERKQEDIIINITNGNLGVFKVAEYAALMSYFFDGRQQIEEFFAPYMDTKLDMKFQEPLSVSQLLAILESLDLSDNLFSKI